MRALNELFLQRLLPGVGQGTGLRSCHRAASAVSSEE